MMVKIKMLQMAVLGLSIVFGSCISASASSLREFWARLNGKRSPGWRSSAARSSSYPALSCSRRSAWRRRRYPFQHAVRACVR